MMANMASSLILHKRIKTTTAKAKALRTFVEPLITKSKDDSTHSRRVVFSYLQDKEAVSELFREISPKIADRPGGYTRILKTGSRLGDNADMCIIELVDYNENLLAVKEEAAAKSTRRRRRGGKKKTEGQVEAVADTAEVSTDETVEAVETEAPAKEEAAEEVKEEAKAEAKEEVKEEEKKEEPKAEAAEKEEKPAEEKNDADEKKEE
jgi:large subunit ribosomal protein L17